jgi:hypothetical protein
MRGLGTWYFSPEDYNLVVVIVFVAVVSLFSRRNYLHADSVHVNPIGYNPKILHHHHVCNC